MVTEAMTEGSETVLTVDLPGFFCEVFMGNRMYWMVRKLEGKIRPTRFYFFLLRHFAECKVCYDGYFMPSIGTKMIDYPEYCVFHADGIVTTYCSNPECKQAKRKSLQADLKGYNEAIALCKDLDLPENDQIKGNMISARDRTVEELAKMDPRYPEGYENES